MCGLKLLGYESLTYKKEQKINGPWEDVSGHFSSLGVGMLALPRFVEDGPWWGGTDSLMT